jgi:GAF domain-containing protein
MLGNPLRQLADEYAELIAVVDRADALRRALARLTSGSEVAWSAWPTGFGALRIEEVVGNKTTRLHSLVVPPGTGLTGKVYLTGQLERVDDYFTSSLITHGFDSHIAAEEVRRLLAVPLIWQGTTLGVLAVGPRDDSTFGDRDIDVRRRWPPRPLWPSRLLNAPV